MISLNDNHSSTVHMTQSETLPFPGGGKTWQGQDWKEGTAVLPDALSARLAVACVLWNKGIDFSGHHAIAGHESSWFQIQNKVHPLVPSC